MYARSRSILGLMRACNSDRLVRFSTVVQFNYIRTMFQFEYITAALFAQYDNYHIPPGDENISSRISTGITDASGS